MKVLLVTSRAASSIVREIVEDLKKQYSGIEVAVYVVDYPTVASSFTVDALKKQVPVDVIRKHDIVIVPGLTRGDLSKWSESMGVPIYKGTIHAVDIPLVIEALMNGIELSKKMPADYVLRERIKSTLRDLIARERSKNNVVINYNGIRITDRSPPIIIISEIPPQTSINESIELAERYEEEGADIIVVGSNSKDPEETIVKISKIGSFVNKPLGIDTNNPKEIIKALNKGVDIVFSLGRDMILRLKDYSKQAIYAIIPDKGYEDPWNINERVYSILENIELAEKQGFDKIIVDPILGPLPLGFTPSLIVFHELKKRRPETPLVFSASNVVESLEADTHGVLAALAGMAFEVGASLFHIVEDAPYEYMNVAEARVALAMAEVAYARKSQERNLGINLLVLKDNRVIRYKPIASKKIIRIERVLGPRIDRAGFFRIIVDRKNDSIEVGFFKYGSGEEAELKITGGHALSIGRRILEEIPEISKQHVLYLGYELARAEIALRLGKNYIQDEELFEPIPEKLEMVEKIVYKDKDAASNDNKEVHG